MAATQGVLPGRTLAILLDGTTNIYGKRLGREKSGPDWRLRGCMYDLHALAPSLTYKCPSIDSFVHPLVPPHRHHGLGRRRQHQRGETFPASGEERPFQTAVLLPGEWEPPCERV